MRLRYFLTPRAHHASIVVSAGVLVYIGFRVAHWDYFLSVIFGMLLVSILTDPALSFQQGFAEGQNAAALEVIAHRERELTARTRTMSFAQRELQHSANALQAAFEAGQDAGLASPESVMREDPPKVTVEEMTRPSRPKRRGDLL